MKKNLELIIALLVIFLVCSFCNLTMNNMILKIIALIGCLGTGIRIFSLK